MENEITKEEYENLLKKDKEIRDKLFELKLQIEMNKNDTGTLDLLMEKKSILKKEWSRTKLLISTYEKNNNRKRGI